MKPLISIIVPVYKAEAYLHRCIDSLLAQTFHNFEILLVDDGSPDKSGLICDDYALKDSRVRVFHKKNGGVSSARQCGIDNALGEYTIHADPDDWVEPTMIEKLYSFAKSENADIVICDYYVNYKNKQIYKKQQPTKLDSKSLIIELFQHLHGSCCNKLIRQSCYSKHNVKFPIGLNLGEDLVFCIRLLLNNDNIKITYLSNAFYHYIQYANENSLVKTSSIKQNEMQYELLKQEMNDACFNMIEPYLIYNISFKSLCNRLYKPKEFKAKFGKYKYKILYLDSRNIILRILLYLACIGGQNISIFFLKIIKLVKG